MNEDRPMSSEDMIRRARESLGDLGGEVVPPSAPRVDPPPPPEVALPEPPARAPSPAAPHAHLPRRLVRLEPEPSRRRATLSVVIAGLLVFLGLIFSVALRATGNG